MIKLFLLWLLISSPAQAADFLSPVASDMSLTLLLQPVFGSLLGV